MHFHCTHVLGALLPLQGAKNTKHAKAGAVIWLDASVESEPRYAHMYAATRTLSLSPTPSLSLTLTLSLRPRPP